MNTPPFSVVLLSAMIVFLGCNNTSTQHIRDDANVNDTPRLSEQDREKNDDEPGWPKDAEGLVEHLNEWHADELIAFNEPERFPNFKTSGETNGWIDAHEEELVKLGVKIRWNRNQQEYIIVPTAESP